MYCLRKCQKGRIDIWAFLGLRCNSDFSTIFALSSGSGKCGVSVIRVSGPNTKQALAAILKQKVDLRPRYAYLRSFFNPTTNEVIDKGLVLWFPQPASFTGEDCCEFHVHGSVAVIAAMVNALNQITGLRPATPGEFTKRAFFNNKMDLTEVEGLADLIHSETEAQRKQALLQSSGSLSRIYANWRQRLIRSAAHMEAYIDFAEDENIEHNTLLQLVNDVQEIKKEIEAHTNDQRQGEILRDGVRTIIVGAPNVGKSSLLNVICQRNISIVTDIAGTTRDIIEATYNISGYPVRFADTAGLRVNTTDPIELEGINKARNYLQQADIILLILDAVQLIENHVNDNVSLQKYFDHYMISLGIQEDDIKGKRLQLIANKVDMLSSGDMNNFQNISTSSLQYISCKTEFNVKEFLKHFEKLLKELCDSCTGEMPRLTQSRYRHELNNCIGYLSQFLTDYSPLNYPDLAISTQKVRQAVRCIERITGHVSSDDILEIIFKDFCIGK